MVGFLLDCNHISAYCRDDARVIERLKKSPAEWLVFACAISYGEVDAGHRMTVTTDQLKREAYERRINEMFVPLDITVKSQTYYGRIMGEIWEKHKPPPRKDTEKWLVEHGVDINDVWFVACAWEHNIIAVTSDKMDWIREAVGGNVTFENWLEKPKSKLVEWIEG